MESQPAESIQVPGGRYLSPDRSLLQRDPPHSLTHTVLLDLAREFGLRASHERTRHQLVFDILKAFGARGTKILAVGMVELSGEAYGFLRWPRLNFNPCP